MLNLYKLEIFATVVQAGSFSAAAQQLFMTQPAVSQHIQDLESGLGVRLFTRGRRGVTLTPPGEILHQYTRQILRLIAEAESMVTQVDQLKSGQVTIGATPGVSIYFLPRWVQSFQQQYPRLTIALQTNITGQIVLGVLSQRLDVGFVEGELEGSDQARLGRTELRDIDLFVVVGRKHPWWDKPAVPITALADQPFIMRQQNSQTRIWLDGVLAQSGVKPRVVAEFDSMEAIKNAVISGMGIAILPDYAVERERDAETLHLLVLEDVALRRSLKLVWDNDTPFTPITRAFLMHLSSQFPQLHKLTEF